MERDAPLRAPVHAWGHLRQGVGFRVQGAGFRVRGSGFRVWDLRLWLRF